MPQLKRAAVRVVRLNPDLDLRYEVPERIADESARSIASIGYGYDGDGRIHVYLEAQDLAKSTKLVCEFLRTSVVLDNDLSRAQVAVREVGSGPLRGPAPLW